MPVNIEAEFQCPKVIESQVCARLPKLPLSSSEWVLLHKNHVMRLQSAYGSVLNRLGLDGVVIHSGSSLKKYSRDDQYWPTIFTPTFAHWTPYQETPALLVIKKESTPILFVEEHASYWEGAAPSSPCWDRESFDIETVTDLGAQRFQGAWAFVGDDMSFATKIGIPVEQRNRQDLQSAIEQFRTLKSDFEVSSMFAANQKALLGHQKLADLFQAGGVSELDLHYEYLKITRQTDLSVAYNDIVALGANCGILHHIHYEDKKIIGDTSLLVDAGAVCNGFASDITRTWVRGQSAEARLFRDLVHAVDGIQLQLVAGFVVGRSYEDLHNHCHQILAEQFVAMGLATCSVNDLVESGATRLFFPHGLGHSLGLQVHDVGMRLVSPAKNNPYLRNTSTIKAGQVATIEPGVYFIPRLMKELKASRIAKSIDWTMIQALEPFGGIRIEDNILASENGPINLTR